MVSGHDLADTDSARLEAVSRVAHQSLLFGEFSAKAAGHDTFEDPVMHTYFLHYMFGATKALAGHAGLGLTLDEDDAVNAMGRALLTFEGTSRQDVMGTLKMLYRARDEAALKIQSEGHDAAERWDWGENREAVFHFAELLKDEANFPREVPSSPAPGDLPGGTS